MRVTILGFSGSGKSTLARQMGEYFKIPYYHLDKVQFVENWELRDRKEALQLVQEMLQKQQWIIDGNYSDFEFEKRLEDADKIIFLNYPRRICLYRALKRVIEFRGKSRDSMAEGCNEKFDLEFFWWIVKDGRSRRYLDTIKRIMEKYPKKYIEIKNARELQQFKEQWESMK